MNDDYRRSRPSAEHIVRQPGVGERRSVEPGKCIVLLRHATSRLIIASGEPLRTIVRSACAARPRDHRNVPEAYASTATSQAPSASEQEREEPGRQ
jgi:hypothetical protein